MNEIKWRRPKRVKKAPVYQQAVTKEKFTQEELIESLDSVRQLFERCMLEDNFILLGNTAKAVKDNLPLPNELEVGIEQRYVSRQVINVFKEFATQNVGESGFTYKKNKIPIKVKFIKKKYNFFKYPDKQLYGYDNYLIPNPFDKYYQSRFLVK